VPKSWGFPLTLIVALTTVLRTTVLHCDNSPASMVLLCYDIKTTKNTHNSNYELINRTKKLQND